MITFTSNSANDFKLLIIGSEDNYLHKNFMNGQSFLFKYDDNPYDFHHFVLITNETMTFHVCHRSIKETKSNDEIKYKNISIGENIYSQVKNFDEIKLSDCFRIEKDYNEENKYDRYMLNYITKTNLLINKKFENGTNEIQEFTNETGNIFLESDVKAFCFELYNDNEYNIYESLAINFELSGIKNESIIQNTIPFLINGVSMRQQLRGGQILYYRLKEYIGDSKFVFLHFKKLKGEIDLFKGFCKDFPNCSFDASNINEFDKIGYIYEENIYFREEIGDIKNVYQTTYFPVYLVYCKSKEDDYCNYIIELNNENNIITLNKDEKFYSKLEDNGKHEYNSCTSTFKFTKSGDTPFSSLELHLLTGEISNISIKGEEYSGNSKNDVYYPMKSFYKYDNQTFYFIKTSFSTNFATYNIEIIGKENSFFYIDYIHGIYEEENSKKSPYLFSLKEMHYNMIEDNFIYSFKKSNINDKYIVSLSGINSYLKNGVNSPHSKYAQFLSKSDDLINIYCIKDSNIDKGLCEFIASSSLLINNTISKVVEFDGFYQFYILNENIKTIKLYYYFTNEELNYKAMFVNINKNTMDVLKIQYGFNGTLENTTKWIYKYNEIFTIDLSNIIKLKKGCELEDIVKEINYFYIIIEAETLKNNYMEFKIKTNIKNTPTYFINDGIELGYLKRNESRYYYFDYKNRTKEETSQDVYLYNKGNVKIESFVLKGEEVFETYKKFDIYDVDYKDEKIWYDIHPIYNNHIKIDYKDCLNDCRFIIRVYLNESDNNKFNDNNLFALYRSTQSKENRMMVDLNTNIYGNIYNKSNVENYYYKTNISNIEGDIVITLNCHKCKMSIKKNPEDEKESLIITTNSIISKSFFGTNCLYYSISGDQGYYYFSFSDSKLPKYIEQLELEPCYNNCTFIFPLHNYYNYVKSLNNGINQTKIIIFVPDHENIIISYDFEDMKEFENDKIINKEDITNEENRNTSNKLYLDLNVSDILVKEKYLRIRIKSTGNEINKYFNFIMNKFINSPNIDLIKYSKNFVSMDINEPIKEDILNLDNNTLYQISLYLLKGNGVISLDKSGNHDYYLDYESQPEINLFVNLSNISIYSNNTGTDSNFIFFINSNKTDEKQQKLEAQKNYKIKYFKDEDKEIFPINIRLSTENQKNKILYINYRFIELEKNEAREDLYNTTDEGFIMNIISERNNVNILENKYYPEFRRGFASIQLNDQFNLDYIDLEINKNNTNSFIYNKVFLEITPLFSDEKVQSKNKNEIGVENIYIPKNTYIQLNINKKTNLIFKEQEPEYTNVTIDIGNTNEFNIINSEQFYFINNKGKMSYRPISKATEYNMIIDPLNSTTIFVRYTEYPYFELSNSTIDKFEKDEKNNVNNTYELKFKKIKLVNDERKNISSSLKKNIKIEYFIRIFDYLLFYDDKEINNILVKENALVSFRREFNETDLNSDEELDFNITFGELKIRQYKYFEENWIIALVVIILIFVASFVYILIMCIKGRKNKKVKIVKELKNEKDENIIKKEEKKEEEEEKEDEKDESDEEKEEENEDGNNSDDKINKDEIKINIINN